LRRRCTKSKKGFGTGLINSHGLAWAKCTLVVFHSKGQSLTVLLFSCLQVGILLKTKWLFYVLGGIESTNLKMKKHHLSNLLWRQHQSCLSMFWGMCHIHGISKWKNKVITLFSHVGRFHDLGQCWLFFVGLEQSKDIHLLFVHSSWTWKLGWSYTLGTMRQYHCSS
jgi:hypothetical protein